MKIPILAICLSRVRGGPKEAVPGARLLRGLGLEGDAHGGNWHRQLSLLARGAVERLEQGRERLPPGAFGENILLDALDLEELTVGRRLRLGREGVIRITQRGKECHEPCEIYGRLGDCVMPREGLFARVERSGELRPGDELASDPALEGLRWAVVVLSDRAAAGEREDRSGEAVSRLLADRLGGVEILRQVLPDDRAPLEALLRRLADEVVVDLVVTSGGTGLSPRDQTPEATRAVVDREIPGLAEEIRRSGLAHTPRAVLHRGICGLRGTTMIVNLSGSPRAAAEQLEALLPALPHALESVSGVPLDCGRS